jgi:hypothetical protein
VCLIWHCGFFIDIFFTHDVDCHASDRSRSGRVISRDNICTKWWRQLCTVTFMQFGKCVKERLKISSQRAGFSHSCHLLMKNVTLGRNSITLCGTFSTSFFRKMIKYLMYLHQKFNILQEPVHIYSIFFSVLYFPC